MIRRSLLAAATLALLAGPALADSTLSVNNTAAGIGNVAGQFVMNKQSGGGLFGGTNTATINNTAAGIGNVAKQGVLNQQSAGGNPMLRAPGAVAAPMVGLGGSNTAVLGNTAAGIGNKAVQNGTVFQKGSPFGANVLNGQNTAAGIGNFAGQSLFSVQR
ncbi:hypothetical protein [Azospirillum sp.]|uniref:hypothetical protein n=1 Tax=Azospirillum sp. TaxID=34012 RepID=UPI002D429AB7|nr:hypothetical protein [Azospirillum sp.]HYD66066.1 hypothetical protein [Azospirillum sp.]